MKLMNLQKLKFFKEIWREKNVTKSFQIFLNKSSNSLQIKSKYFFKETLNIF